jgi:hypothetical protein
MNNMKAMRKCNDEICQLAKDQVGKKIKDKKERVCGSASYKHYIRRA